MAALPELDSPTPSSPSSSFGEVSEAPPLDDKEQSSVAQLLADLTDRVGRQEAHRCLSHALTILRKAPDRLVYSTFQRIIGDCALTEILLFIFDLAGYRRHEAGMQVMLVLESRRYMSRMSSILRELEAAYVKTLKPEEVTYAQVECAVRNNFQLPGIADVPAAAVDSSRSYPSATVERPKKPWETPGNWVLVVNVGSSTSCEMSLQGRGFLLGSSVLFKEVGLAEVILNSSDHI
ncbi:hypothetical protein FOL46_006894 [Perkinsus olseni]|uniref:Peroxisomal membrane protein PEX14-like KPWE domain-containing protein n=1 Tax=Perkinsus olseni TaxID=32597 RepID=A0A7J6LHU5_PEROL|nr:hypothetical protein FOL46_006894 [Perkinsus olseni]